MRYINPFRLFHLPEHQAANEASVAQISARLRQLQQNAASGTRVPVADHQLDKEELDRLLHEWENPQLREFHRLILSKYKKLYNFLEYGHLGLFREKESQVHALWEDEDFIHFIQPYFSTAYSEHLLQAVRFQDTEAVEALSKHNLPVSQPELNEENQHSSEFDAVVEYLKNNTTDLAQLAAQDSLPAMSEREILSYLPDKSIEIYNSLPDQFASLRNQLGYEVKQLAFVLNNELGRNDGAEALVRQGLKLKLDEQVQRDLEAMLAHHKGKSGIPLWLIIGISVIALLFFIQYLEN